MENRGTTRQYYSLSDVCSQTIRDRNNREITALKIYRWNVIDNLAKPIRRQMKATKQRGGVPAYLNLYNIVNWTTTYEPTATLEELMSISLFNFCVCT